MNERILLGLFGGMLLYKALDLLAVSSKLDQALIRARRRQLLPLHRRTIVRLKRANPRGYHRVFRLQWAIERVDQKRVWFFQTPILSAFAWLGISQITLNSDGSGYGTLVVGVATIILSATVSSLSLLIERYRILLEHV